MDANDRSICTRRGALKRVAGLAALAFAPAGCGYSMRAPFAVDEKTKSIYVPVFKSYSFRRDVNFMLTDLVQKEIQTRTPYHLVGKPEQGDTVLDGEINFADKNVVVENPYNLPRQLNATMTATVNWTHNPKTEEEAARLPTMVSATVNFIPEVGETSEMAFYRACQALARQIVDMMENPW